MIVLFCFLGNYLLSFVVNFSLLLGLCWKLYILWFYRHLDDGVVYSLLVRKARQSKESQRRLSELVGGGPHEVLELRQRL